MKKIFTLICAASFATAAWAEAPVLLFRGEPVEAGKTYEAGYTVERLEIDGVPFEDDYKQDSHLTLRGENGAGVVVEVKASEAVQVCSIDGQCTTGDNVTKQGILGSTNVVSLDGNIVTVDLVIDKTDYDFTFDPNFGSTLKNITLNVTAYYTATPNDKATASVIMRNVLDSELSGIAAVGQDNAKVTFFGNTLEYNVAQPTKLDIYNTSGSLVMSRKICSTGSISLDSLHPGVYIYSANGTTGKILVRK